MANYLNKVLSGLHVSDTLLSGRLDTYRSDLSGLLSTAFTSGRITIGDGSKLTASNFTLDDATTSAAFTTGTLSTKIANEEAVKAYVDDKVSELSTTQGTALTGITAGSQSVSVSATAEKTKDVTVDVVVDGNTIIKTNSGLQTNIALSAIGGNATYANKYALVDMTTSAQIGATTIDIKKDQFLTSAYYDATTENLVLQFQLSGAENTGASNEVSIPVHDLVHEYNGSNAIAVADTTAGSSTISLKLDVTTEGTEAGNGKFLSITSNGLLLSGVQDAIDDAKNELWDSTNHSGSIYSALSGYTGANAVSTEFKTITDRLDAAGLGTYTPDNVLIGSSTSGISASSFKIGGTDATSFGANDELAVESAVKTYVDDKVSGAVSGVTTADQFVFGKGNGAVQTTGKTLLTSTNYANEDSMTDSVIPTAAAVKAYVNDGLSEILANVNSLISDLHGTPIPTT